jgi:hypothetical protein
MGYACSAGFGPVFTEETMHDRNNLNHGAHLENIDSKLKAPVRIEPH